MATSLIKRGGEIGRALEGAAPGLNEVQSDTHAQHPVDPNIIAMYNRLEDAEPEEHVKQMFTSPVRTPCS